MQLLVSGGHVITMDDARRSLEADIAIVDGRIAGLGARSDLVAQHGEPDEVLDASGRYVIPGLINAHTHTFQSALRGLGDGYGLSEWRTRLTQPAYMHLTAEDAYWFTLLGCLENLRSGVTTVVNFQAYPNDFEACRLVAKAFGESGLRGLLAKSFYASGARAGLLSDRESVMADLERVFAELNGSFEGRVRFCVGPPNPMRAPADWIQGVHEISARHESGLHIHIAEAPEDAQEARAHFGTSELAYLGSLGVVDSRFQAAHCVWIDPEDIPLMVRHGGNIVHNPVSNMYLGSGIADVPAMLAASVNVALGSDGPASNNNQDMFAAMKAASLLQKVAHVDAALIPPGVALEMATRNGARAAYLDAGEITPGKLADLAILDLSGVHHQPLHRPASSIVYCGRPEDVESVVVNGRVVMRDRVISGVDEREVVAEAATRASRILRDAHLEENLRTGWPWT